MSKIFGNVAFFVFITIFITVSYGYVSSGEGISPKEDQQQQPALQIVEMRVPLVVEDGSSSSVILDCDYVLRFPEKRSELVVQWYFQNGSSPVYQWIPGKRPQDLGILKGRLNLDHRASNDPFKRHRALEILRPTYELSGVYRCKVATVEEEAVMAKTMIVYTPARHLEIWHHKMPYDAVNVTCRAEGISPRPRIQLFRGDRPGVEMEGIPAEVSRRGGASAGGGLFDVTLHRVVQDRSLRQETIFECVLSIPGTPYQMTKRLIYYPGPAPIRSSSPGVQWCQRSLLLALLVSMTTV